MELTFVKSDIESVPFDRKFEMKGTMYPYDESIEDPSTVDVLLAKNGDKIVGVLTVQKRFIVTSLWADSSHIASGLLRHAIEEKIVVGRDDDMDDHGIYVAVFIQRNCREERFSAKTITGVFSASDIYDSMVVGIPFIRKDDFDKHPENPKLAMMEAVVVCVNNTLRDDVPSIAEIEDVHNVIESSEGRFIDDVAKRLPTKCYQLVLRNLRPNL